MPLSNITGHQRVLKRLKLATESDHLPSAYLFSGIEGVGKSTVARFLAQKVNCECRNEPGECANCRLFETENHPDFLVVKPKGKFIQIGQIQELIQQLNLKPAYAKKRCVLVKDAHCFNPESANCFLKILEEPPLDTMIVVTVPDESLLLETVLSRCQKLPFLPLSSEELQKIYNLKFKLSQTEIDQLLAFSDGGLRKDLISNLPVLPVIKQEAFEILTGLENAKMTGHCLVAEQWVQKDRHLLALEVLMSLLRDFQKLLEDPNDIRHKDLFQDFDPNDLPFDSEQLDQCFNLSVETEIAIKANASKQFAMENLLIRYKKIKQHYLVV